MITLRTPAERLYILKPAGTVRVHPASFVAHVGGGGPRPDDLPASIARDQKYYWTARWRADETESLRELEAGEGVKFSTANEAIRWLLSATDD